ELLGADPDADERAQRRAVVAWCRSMGQIPEKRIRCEFMTLTAQIGCPEFTRVHDLRHLFTSRAQAADINPILVAHLVGAAQVLRPHTPLWFSTNCLPYDFAPSVDCPRWSAFLERNLGDDPGKQRLLQQWEGVPIAARHQALSGMSGHSP